MKKVFVSTSIPFVNASPHLGHALEFVQADVIARRHRLSGDSVFFLSGTDENSLKNVRSAEKAGMPVKDFVDENFNRFFELKNALNLSMDEFIRTTEERHLAGAQKLWQACSKNIYKKKYSGLYCVGCEEFYKEDELEDGLCPEHKKKPELVEEENYFFRLSDYQDKLKELIEKDELKIIPESRKNEVLKFVESGLQDFCISRSNERAKGWGVDVPGDPDQKMWVWFDALSNYINGLGYGEGGGKFNEFWQKSDARVHVVGKGIIRFHAVYWPAMLLSAGLALPKTLFVHGYLTVDGQKMSKSIGNVVDPLELVKKYGTDGVRYFLLREIPATGDGDFSFEKFEKRYNSDLASGLGNLFSRTVAMVIKAGLGDDFKIEPEPGFREKVREVGDKVGDGFVQFGETLSDIWELVSFCDKYIDEEKPWEIKDVEKQKAVFSNLLFSLTGISGMLKPFLPETSEKMEEQLGESKGIFNVKKGEPLFPRI